ncbi:MAG: oxygen-dependent coproporphyrinogen oxidase [Rhabdochlamydiaceae bacterium]|nr:oxygen-dependent coproporphyrinogen oxidase [Candidatus Amphrikana amoebophyrae]
MKEQFITFFKKLREQIIGEFESLEPSKRLERTKWDHKGGGGGEMGILRGDIFEKAGVNFSQVMGETFPGADGSGPYFASGVSLITHMHNPKLPTVHMNVRYISTESGFWVGGGYDLTPMGFIDEQDTRHFHQSAKNALDKLDPTFYPRFMQNAKEYFYIPHRKKERGVGGIFFDHFGSDDAEMAFKLVKATGESFIEAIMPIYRKKINLPYTELEKDIQLHQRAHYAEFNLVYDRGTQFGFKSGGNPDAILASMPPLAKW